MMAPRALTAVLILASLYGFAASRAAGNGMAAVAGVLVPCPGTSDPIQAGAPCGLVCRAELPVRRSGTRLLVDIRVNGKPAWVELDTGSNRSGFSQDAAARLGLPLATQSPGLAFATGGAVRSEISSVRELTFGHVDLGPQQVVVWPNGTMQLGGSSQSYDGLLGNDVLNRYQIDFDFGHDVVRFYQGRRCSGPLPGWPGRANAVPLLGR